MVTYLIFLALVGGLLALDLGVFSKEVKTPSFQSALKWTAFWVSIGLLFCVFVYFLYEGKLEFLGVEPGSKLNGMDASILYLTGFIIEESLSLDNIFIMAMIFAYFKVPSKYHHRILFYGVAGAVIFRAIMIFVGVALLQHFSWLTYLFAGILLYSAVQLLGNESESEGFEENFVLKFLQKQMNIDYSIVGTELMVKRNGKRVFTLTFVVILTVEISDIMFAFDSVPAIFALTTDPFIVFTSNIFAILGLRSLYFVLAALLEKFKYIKISLAIILLFVGLKMMVMHFLKIPALVSLAVILLTLAVGIIASLMSKTTDTPEIMFEDAPKKNRETPS